MFQNTYIRQSIVLISFCLALLSSCSTTSRTSSIVMAPMDIEINGDIGTCLIPLSTILYIPPQTRNYIFHLGKSLPFLGINYGINVGNTYLGGVSEILKGAFSVVNVVESMPDALETDQCYVIIVSSIQDIKYMEKKKEETTFFYPFLQIETQWDILTPDHRKIYTNLVRTQTEINRSIGWTIKSIREQYRLQTTKSLKENLEMAQGEIYRSGWWKDYIEKNGVGK